MHRPNRTHTTSMWRGVIAICCAATLAATSCGGSDDSSPAATSPAEPAATDPPETTTSSSVQSNAARLPDSPTSIEPGVYGLDQIGLDGSFAVDDDWFLEIAGPTEITFHDPDGGLADREVQILRPDFLVDPTYVAPPDPNAVTPDDHWPVDDAEGWAATETDTWNTSDIDATTIAGWDAVSFTIAPDIAYCDGDRRCGAPVAFAEDHALLAWEDNQQRIWWVADIDGKAFAISAVLGPEADETWFDDVQSIVDSIELTSTPPS